MRRGTFELIVFVGLLSVGLSSVQGAPAGPDKSQSLALEKLPAAWKALRIYEINSPEYLRTRRELDEMVQRVAASRRAEAAGRLMDRYAPENVNAAAIGLFGDDPFSGGDMRKILLDPKRTARQRVLLRTYFALVRGEYRPPRLTEKTRARLVHLLTTRIEALIGKKTSYGERRLLTHLVQPVLSRYAEKVDEVDHAKQLVEALRGYADAAESNDIFAASVRGWLKLMESPSEPISVSVAEDLLGHWDPLVRMEASCFLGRRMRRRGEIVEQVWEVLSDPRDEVRAAAVMAFAVGVDAKPDGIIERLIQMLTADRGVVVQAAAGVAIAARGDEGQQAVQPLLDRFKPLRNRRRPGPKRTGSILSALGSLVSKADQAQRKQMLALAVEKLEMAPWGALVLLKALGPEAKSALPRILQYQSNASRSERRYIDRHVVPAITFGLAATKKPIDDIP